MKRSLSLVLFSVVITLFIWSTVWNCDSEIWFMFLGVVVFMDIFNGRSTLNDYTYQILYTSIVYTVHTVIKLQMGGGGPIPHICVYAAVGEWKILQKICSKNAKADYIIIIIIQLEHCLFTVPNKVKTVGNL